MELDDAKENIQPLAAGRNISILQASLRVDSTQELHSQRQQLEQDIHNYEGDDPLASWYTYISWIEQSYPSGGKESGLDDVLTKCLARFEDDERYYQDRRMIKLYIKFIDSHKDPTECYQQLFNAGIGTMVADLYICWAYYYDLVGNTRKADEIFRRGIACRAQPFEDLQEAHQHFGFSVAQRLMYQDDENVKEDANRQLQERRLALTSLRGYRRKATVGSIRTGAAVRSYTPGTVQSEKPTTSRQSNARVCIFKDENENPNLPPISDSSTEIATATTEEGRSVVRSIIDAARNQENLKEPGPWNRANEKKKSGKLFSKCNRVDDLGFSIHVDDATDDNNRVGKPLNQPIATGVNNFNKPFKYPECFQSKNNPQPDWITAVTIENEPDPHTFPEYNKCMLYPRPNMELQTEELCAYYFFKRRDVVNEFTMKRSGVWSTHDITANVRQYPNFAKYSKVQERDDLDKFYKPEKNNNLMVSFEEIYDANAQEEFQIEELKAHKIRRNNTIMQAADMEETMCDGLSDKLQRRKSFFPSRKSIAPKRFGEIVTLPMQNEEETLLQKEELLKEEAAAQNIKVVDTPLHPAAAAAIEPSCSKDALSFEIFPNSMRVACLTPPTLTNQHHAEYPVVDFKFKTPAIPTVAIAKQKIPFEIYTEITSPPQIVTEAATPTDAGIFDPEETCSTQTFNIFLRSQSVSTPKIPLKVAQRQFGTVLKPPSPPPQQAQSDEQLPSPVPIVNAREVEQITEATIATASHITSFSPLQPKQLSTILETSEHGSTQGTHTTGVSTKSTISSPEFADMENNGASYATATTTPRIIMPHSVLETLQEQSRESSTTSAAANVAELMDSMHIEAKHIGESDVFDMFELTKNKNSNLNVPATGDHASIGAKNFSIFEDHTDGELEPKEVGNYTHLDEREGTESYSAIRSVCFQESKTGDFPKMLASTTPSAAMRLMYEDVAGDKHFSIFEDHTDVQMELKQTDNFTRLEECEDTGIGFAMRSVRFQEDKTDTIPKMLFSSTATPVSARLVHEIQADSGAKNFSIFEDHTDFQLEPKQAGNFTRLDEREDTGTGFTMRSVRFQEDKTETNSKMLFATNASTKFEEDKTETISKILLAPPMPPKFEDKTETLSRIAVPTPSLPAAVDTTANLEHSFEFFVNSPPKNVKTNFLKSSSYSLYNTSKGSPMITSFSKRVCDRDTPEIKSKLSFLQKSKSEDMTNSESKLNAMALFKDEIDILKTSSKTKGAATNLSDSLAALEDYSVVMPRQTEIVKPTMKSFHDSFMPEFSVIEETPPEQPAKPVASYVGQPKQTATNVNLSYVKNSEPCTNISLLKQHRCTSDIGKSKIGDSILKDFSLIMDSQPLECELKWRQNKPMVTQDATVETKDDTQPHMLMQSYMADFSAPKDIFNVPSTIKFRNDSKVQLTDKSLIIDSHNKSKNGNDSSYNFPPPPSNKSLKFLPDTSASQTRASKSIRNTLQTSTTAYKSPQQVHSSNPAAYELDAETEIELFATYNNKIKNSTLLPKHEQFKESQQIRETSLHIKAERPSMDTSYTVFKSPPLPPSAATLIRQKHQASTFKLSFLGEVVGKFAETTRELSRENLSNNSLSTSAASASAVPKKSLSIATDKPSLSMKHNKVNEDTSVDDVNDDNCNMSIYYKHTPKTPQINKHKWDDDASIELASLDKNSYVHHEVDLNQTHQMIENFGVDSNVNPFSTDLINAFLDHIDFTNYINDLPSCKLIGHIPRLRPSTVINVYANEFEVVKLIGEGAYGSVYCGLQRKSNTKYALKQERPPNYWEYYICLEVHSRLKADEMISAYMSVDYALIANNSSVLISQFSPHGSLIAVCNKIKKHTLKNMDEYVVMLLVCELLEILDHLHAMGIIHADIKADNFLLMKKLSYPSTEFVMQLIDFGVSIDMKLFQSGQTFSYIHDDNAFKCVEMRECRPWTYQLDLYGLAGVIHVMLFGKYMEIEKHPKGNWMHKTRMPRYFNKTLWDTIFNSLLNIYDCDSMPNLQQLRALLKEEMAEKEKYVLKKIVEFNMALLQ